SAKTSAGEVRIQDQRLGRGDTPAEGAGAGCVGLKLLGRVETHGVSAIVSRQNLDAIVLPAQRSYLAISLRNEVVAPDVREFIRHHRHDSLQLAVFNEPDLWDPEIG